LKTSFGESSYGYSVLLLPLVLNDDAFGFFLIGIKEEEYLIMVMYN
jgi:hypothetical protein